MLSKREAMERFGMLWDEYVLCPPIKLTPDALLLADRLQEIIGEYKNREQC